MILSAARRLALLLKRFGPCDIASDGVEALEAVELALKEREQYDLICLDIQMPNLNGQDCLAGIRKREEEFGIPLGHGAKVLMATAFDDSENVFKAFRHNADGYLTKPILSEQLISMVEKLGLNHD